MYLINFCLICCVSVSGGWLLSVCNVFMIVEVILLNGCVWFVLRLKMFDFFGWLKKNRFILVMFLIDMKLCVCLFGV